MFTSFSFDETGFWNAITEKDMLHLKINTISTILNDPTFEGGETDKVIEILEKEIPQIFEPEVTLEYEERLDRDKWNKRYFVKLTYWFQENFAKSRINYIKEVGRYVHRDTPSIGKEVAAYRTRSILSGIIQDLKELKIKVSFSNFLKGFRLNKDNKEEFKRLVMEEIKKQLKAKNESIYSDIINGSYFNEIDYI